jgi:hypothetical protein
VARNGAKGSKPARIGDDQAASDAAFAVWQLSAHEVFTFEGDGADFHVWALSLTRRQVSDHPRPDPAGPQTRPTTSGVLSPR